MLTILCRVNTTSLTCKSKLLYLAPEALAQMKVAAFLPCVRQLRLECIHERLLIVREDSDRGPSGGFRMEKKGNISLVSTKYGAVR